MKGRMIKQYRIGQLVNYKLTKTPDCRTGTGTIHKLHVSGSSGVAEIKPSNGSHKISRRLIHVSSLE